MDLARARQIAAGPADGDRVDVGGVHLGAAPRGGQCRGRRARAAAQVDDGRDGARGVGEQVAGEGEQELGAAPGHEDTGPDRDPQPRELGPADDVFQRMPGGPQRHQPVECGEAVAPAGGGRLGQQGRLLLGEDAAGGAQADGGRRDGGGRDGGGRDGGGRNAGVRAEGEEASKGET